MSRNKFGIMPMYKFRTEAEDLQAERAMYITKLEIATNLIQSVENECSYLTDSSKRTILDILNQLEKISKEIEDS